ncbi:MAG: prolyl oligopeptidase family serine peptidase [Steroidobacteraceae bacterium]
MTAQPIHSTSGRARRVSAFSTLAVLLLCATGCATTLQLANSHYPRAPRGDIADDYFGVRVADPYRWLEDLESPATNEWIAAENAVAEPLLQKLPHRAWLQARLTQLYAYERFGVPEKAGGRYFFLRNDGLQNQAALHVSTSLSELGTRLIEPDNLRGDATVALADYVPSPDGRLLAYALSDAGSDWKTWHVREVDTTGDRADVLRDTKFTRVAWARDSGGFYYGRYPAGDDQRQPEIWFHKLGDPQSADRHVFSVTDHPRRTPEARVTEDGRYLVITIDDGTLTNGVTVLNLANGKTEPLFSAFDGLNGYIGSRATSGADGKPSTELLFTTTSGAPRGRIVAVDLGKPAALRLRVVVPEAPDVLQGASLVGDRLIASWLKDAHSEVALFAAIDGRRLKEVELPGLGSVSGFTGENADTETFFSYADFSTPSRIYGLDTASGRVRLLREPQFAGDVTPYVTEQVFYRSKDGTRVPMFLVHRRDLKRDGDSPVMLYGYGGFDISMTPAFAPATIAWLEMGGVYAVANLRGGGEYGAAWHKAGTRSQKQNVFDDFIAAAEYLVEERYTTPGRITVRGGSNGGLLVGAVLTQRPELFGAALPDVGVLDMLRYHLASANARLWADDFGLSEDEGDFRAQLAYSPLHNADRHHCYPPTLVTTASRDNRVVPWHSFKFAAALQASQRCDNPVLIRIETRAGHGAGKPQWMQIEHFAQSWAFAAAATGMKLPPPLPPAVKPAPAKVQPPSSSSAVGPDKS